MQVFIHIIGGIIVIVIVAIGYSACIVASRADDLMDELLQKEKEDEK